MRSLLSGPPFTPNQAADYAVGDLVVRDLGEDVADDRFVGPSGSPACHLSIARQLPLSCSPRRKNGPSELHPV